MYDVLHGLGRASVVAVGLRSVGHEMGLEEGRLARGRDDTRL